MKRLLGFTILFVCAAAWALPLGKEGKQEAQLFNAFLEAVYATPQDPARTFEALEKVLAREPDSKYIRRLLVSLAVGMDKPQQAKPYADYIDMGENDAEDWGTYAAYQWRSGQVTQARQSYEKSLQLDPENNQILYQYLLLLASLPPSQALDALENFAVQYPAQASTAYLAAGRLCARQQRWQKALAYLDKSIQADPLDPAPRIAKSEIYEQTSQYFLLLHELEELEKTGYTNAGTLSRMGAVFVLVKDIAKAKEYFLRAKTADKADPAANYFLSLFAEQEGDLSSAITYLQDSAEYKTKSSYWLQVAFFEQRLNQPQESLRTLQQAHKHFPGNVEIGFFYGLMLNDTKHYKKAADVFKQILQTNPGYEDARLHYAYSLESLHRYKEMEKQLGILLGANPKNASALNLYAYSLAERNERLDQAQEYITRALAAEPNDYSFIDTQAWVYIRQNQLEKADGLLSSLPEQFIRENAEVSYHLGVLRARQGRTEEALAYLEQARDNWPAAAKLYRKMTR